MIWDAFKQGSSKKNVIITVDVLQDVHGDMIDWN